MKKLIAALFLCTTACWGQEGIELLISPQEISQKVAEVAAEINREYSGKEVTVIMVMKGALCITSDLIRQLNVPTTVEYVKASSYGENGAVRGELKVVGLDQLDLKGKEVLIVDDIFDTGHTMSALVEKVKQKEPSSLKSLVLLVKNVPHSTSYRPDYTLFEIENHFVIGYGLDYKEHYRGLPGVYYFTNNTPPDELLRN